MGLFTSSVDTSASRELRRLWSQEQDMTEEERLRFEEEARTQEEEALGATQRQKGQRGGGRVGLMFMGNQQGVV